MSGQSMLDPPSHSNRAKFEDSFGQRVLLTVDTEEEFDWDGPFSATEHGLDHVPAITRFQNFCEELGVSPLYLVDWPIVQSDRAVNLIGDAIKRGKAEVGIQLHPWVNPPHDEEVNVHNSFAGNLPRELEVAKFPRLRDSIEEKFGAAPLSYRAGRYGLGPDSAQMLMNAGVAIDTSVRSNYNYSDQNGPNYSKHPLEPYWVDDEKQLLELPVTTVFRGILRKQGKMLRWLPKPLPTLASAMSRTGILEKIPLTPEGVTIAEALRGAEMAIDDGLPIIVLSFHSPSLAIGHTPYVRNDEDLEALYEWLRLIYAFFAKQGIKSTTIAEIMRSVVR